MFKEKLTEAIYNLAQENGWNPVKYSPKPLPAQVIRYAIADQTENAKHDPASVKDSYMALKAALVAQFNVLIGLGLTVKRHMGNGEPYSGSADMVAKVTDTLTFYYLPTDTAYGQGSQANDSHMLAQTGVSDSDGNPLILNDVFRIVHDLVAHYIGGNSFSGKGEFNGWLVHTGTLPKTALAAITAETISQTAFFEWGSHLRRSDNSIPKNGDADYIPRCKRPFAEQKNFYPAIALLLHRQIVP